MALPPGTFYIIFNVFFSSAILALMLLKKSILWMDLLGLFGLQFEVVQLLSESGFMNEGPTGDKVAFE